MSDVVESQSGEQGSDQGSLLMFDQLMNRAENPDLTPEEGLALIRQASLILIFRSF